MSDSPLAGRAAAAAAKPGAMDSPQTVTRTRSGDMMVRPQPVTEQSLMESVAGKIFSNGIKNICIYTIMQTPDSFTTLYPCFA